MLRKKLDRLFLETKRPVVVFDLDGTLFDVTYRQLEIFKRLLQKNDFQKMFPEEYQILKTLDHQDFHYGIADTFKHKGINPKTPYFNEFYKIVKNFWINHFFTNELVQYDRPFQDAQRCVDYFYRQGAHIVYLSGRDEPNMQKGTLVSLNQHGFPTDTNRSLLCLKPKYGEDDLLFKENALETIQNYGDIIATFDNEPENVQMFIEKLSNAVHIHFHSLYSKHIDLKGKNLFKMLSFSEHEW